MNAAARLPGIRIEAAPSVPPEGLPPMDVAVFVGLAARGPVHRPVAVDGLAQYQAIFGGDLDLAFDPQRGEPLLAHLGQTVRSFFANGGRRCWVIRVARTSELEQAWSRIDGRIPAPTATRNRLPVSGVLALPMNGADPAAAMIQARSLGGWSDGLRLSTALAATGIQLLDCAAVDPPTAQRIRLRSATPLYPGDLIELDPGGGAATRVFARIDAAGAADGGAPEIQATLLAAFEPVADVSASAEPVEAEIAGLAGTPLPAQLQAGAASLARLRFEAAVPDGLAVGHWVRYWPASGERHWLRVDRRLEQTERLVVEGPVWRQRPTTLPDPAPTRAARLTLELRVDDAAGDVQRLPGLGLTADHPAAWWQRLDDDTHYDRARMLRGARDLGEAVRDDSFPLAASAEEIAHSPTWIPLGVEPLFGPALGVLPQATDRLERDGLARFDAELFLDPELAEVGSDRLLQRAEELRLLSVTPRKPFGIHAALAIGDAASYNDASLIAVPDAVHPGWGRPLAEDLPTATPQATPPAHWLDHRGPCAGRASHSATAATTGPAASSAPEGPDFSRFLDCTTRRLEPPELDPLPGPVPRGTFTLGWTSTEAGATFMLEESRTGAFDDARTVYSGPDSQASILADREGIYYYQVSGCAGSERSTPSAPITVLVRDTDWIVESGDGPTEAGAADPGTDTLLRIHQALLRLASANGELFAVLSLPRRFRSREAIGYSARLRAVMGSGPSRPGVGGGTPPLPRADRRALSFGAIYHPWPTLPSPDQARTQGRPSSTAGESLAGPGFRACPPDGAAVGILASRSRRRGPWIAPANQPLADLIALTPAIDPSDRLALQQARINLLRAEPRGFMVLAAETLSDDPDWTTINVRRLFCLLRRLAIRRGQRYVFEPNGDLLRRAVERGFTDLLDELFRRGAFAGASADASFQVATSGALNTPADRDAGRFLVELRVAPALPLRFLGLRLLQQGEQLSVLEGV